MCDFISWIEYEGHNYFLTDIDLVTKEGRKLRGYLGNKFCEDIPGHGAIRYYYPELKTRGINKECTDFSIPNNFPKEIIKAIKNCRLKKIGYNYDLLNELGQAEYKKIEQSELPAWVEYKKIKQLASAEYEKIKQPALAKYRKIEQSALAEYRKIEQPALAECEKIEQLASAEYKEIIKARFWDIFSQAKYRNKKWK